MKNNLFFVTDDVLYIHDFSNQNPYQDTVRMLQVKLFYEEQVSHTQVRPEFSKAASRTSTGNGISFSLKRCRSVLSNLDGEIALAFNTKRTPPPPFFFLASFHMGVTVYGIMWSLCLLFVHFQSPFHLTVSQLSPELLVSLFISLKQIRKRSKKTIMSNKLWLWMRDRMKSAHLWREE